MREEGFYVTPGGELIFKGEVIKVNAEFQLLPDSQKSEILILLINWANDEMEKLNQNK